MAIKKYLDQQGLEALVQNIKDYIDANIVLQYQSIYNFPSIGKEGSIYIDTSQNRTYRWDDDNLKYYCIGSDYDKIEIIDGGSSRK